MQDEAKTRAGEIFLNRERWKEIRFTATDLNGPYIKLGIKENFFFPRSFRQFPVTIYRDLLRACGIPRDKSFRGFPDRYNYLFGTSMKRYKYFWKLKKNKKPI